MRQESLRQQSFQLLRQQANKLKNQNKDLELKQDQIKFLKETILALQQQKDAVSHQNNQLKNKLKTMANQITQYNSTVVQKIYEQNQQLNQELGELKEENQKLLAESHASSNKIRQLQTQRQSQLKQKNQTTQNCESLKQLKTKTDKKIVLLQKENKELQLKNISLQRQVDQTNNQINYCSQQIDILTQKHHDALKTSEKKLKQTVQKMVPKEQLERLQKQNQQISNKFTQIKIELTHKIKEQDKLTLESTNLKDKLLNLELQQQTKSLQYKIDIVNLAESVKIGKKISEFQSQEHQKVDYIYFQHKQLQQKIQKQDQILFSYEKKLKQLQSQLKICGETIRMVENEQRALRERKEDQQQSLQNQYQGRLMEISLRLKKEEIALARHQGKEEELQQIKQLFQKEKEQRLNQKQTLTRTIQQLSKQNGNISEQLGSALKLCQQNILNKECITHYKYTLQDIIGVVYYLHLLLLRHKQKSTKLYMPFINYYLTLHSTIQPYPKKRSAVSKFKTGVWMVVALIRMKRQGSRGSNLERYVSNAIQQRYHIQNLGQHIEKVSNCILNGGKVNDIIKISKQIYKWNIHNFRKIRLPQIEDKKIICEQLELMSKRK